jgi:hypothetical protein
MGIYWKEIGCPENNSDKKRYKKACCWCNWRNNLKLSMELVGRQRLKWNNNIKKWTWEILAVNTIKSRNRVELLSMIANFWCGDITERWWWWKKHNFQLCVSCGLCGLEARLLSPDRGWVNSSSDISNFYFFLYPIPHGQQGKTRRPVYKVHMLKKPWEMGSWLAQLVRHALQAC